MRQDFASDQEGTKPGYNELRPGWVRKSCSDTRCRETMNFPAAAAGYTSRLKIATCEDAPSVAAIKRAEDKIIHTLSQGFDANRARHLERRTSPVLSVERQMAGHLHLPTC